MERGSVLTQAPFHDAGPALTCLRDEVIAGLSRRPKALSPKLLYDDTGSRIFEVICELPEYYPARTESAILAQHAGSIGEMVGSGCVLVEPGAGSCRKIEHLLDALAPQAYVPVDIAGTHVRAAAERLRADYPAVPVSAVCADFGQLDLLDGLVPEGRRVLFFPGSTIGNFEPAEVVAFLQASRRFVGTGGGLLIGVDLKKPSARLNAAYNDAQGVTAAFNLNVLTRINRELDGNFDGDRFYHRAFFSEHLGRVEMHLVSKQFQQVSVGGHRFAFGPGESIHTENSYKYTVGGFREIGRRAGFEPQGVWTDPEQLFSVHFFSVPDLHIAAERDNLPER